MKLKEDEQVSVDYNSSTEDEDITIDKFVTAFTCQQQQVEVDAVSGWPSQKLNLQSWQHIRRDRLFKRLL